MFGSQFRDFILCPAPLKKYLATRECLLIDDSERNVEEFIAFARSEHLFGVGALLFPQPWNSAYESIPSNYGDTDHTQNMMDYIKKIMEN